MFRLPMSFVCASSFYSLPAGVVTQALSAPVRGLLNRGEDLLRRAGVEVSLLGEELWDVTSIAFEHCPFISNLRLQKTCLFFYFLFLNVK